MDGEPSNEIIETAKAVQATAKATKDALRLVEKTGRFLDRVFGDPSENLVGIVADRIRFLRLRHYLRLRDNVEKIMREKGYSEEDITRTVPLRVGVPLIESATLEDNDELRTLWARLLANAMDPEFHLDIKVRHVSLLREMEPLDLRILRECYLNIQARFRGSPLNRIHFKRPQIAESFELSEESIEVSLLNLIRLGCVDPGFVPTPMATNVGGHQLNYSVYVGTERFTLTLLGAELCKAAMAG